MRRFLSVILVWYFLAAGHAARADIASNLALRLKLDEGSGSIAMDSSGNQKNGSLVGSPSWAAGKVGAHAVSFNGANNYASLGAHTFGVAAGEDLTVSAWVKTTDQYGLIVSLRSTADHPVFDLAIGHNGNAGNGNAGHFLPLTRFDDGNGLTEVTTAPNIADGNWHLVAVVLNQTALTLTAYVDGTPYSTSLSTTGAMTFVTDIGIGAELNWIDTNNLDADKQHLNGTVDDVRIYYRALSQADITELYNFQEPSAPVVSGLTTTTGTVGTTFSSNIQASNNPTSYTLANGTLPAGLSLNTTTGAISGTPTGGSSTFSVTATNEGGTSQAASLTITISTAGSADITSDLALRLKLDEGSGSIAADSSGNQKNGSLVNNPSWVAGKIGAHALFFDGTSNYASLGAHTFGVAAGGNLTVSAWVKTTDQYGLIVSLRSTADHPVFDLAIGHNGNAGNGNAGHFLPLTRFDDGSGLTEVTTAPNIADGNWHLVAVVLNQTALTLTAYVDGTPYSTSLSTTGAMTFVTNIGIGAELNWIDTNNLDGDKQHLNGTIDDVRIYYRALSQADITELYNFQETSAPVVSGLTMLTGTVGTTFSSNIQASNNPTSYTLANGTLPAGLSLNTTTGAISGTPTGGSSTFSVTATNNGGTSQAATFTITINAAPSDTQAPTVPASLAASNVTATSFALSWSASSDNVGVTGYRVQKDGDSPITTISTSLSLSDLTQGTVYVMKVQAGDAAGNWSDWSSPLPVTTSDIQAPSVPTGLDHSSVTTSSFTLSWNAATDNLAVTSYEVLKDGAHYGNTGATSMSVTGLSANTTYALTVKASDAAGNTSAASSAHSVTTNAAVPGAPVITSSTSALGVVGTPFIYTISATNNPTGYDVEGTLPAGLTRSELTVVNDNDAGVSYGSNSSGSWDISSQRQSYANYPQPDLNGDVHYAINNGDWASFTFTGTAIQFLSETYSDEGTVDVYIDDHFQQTVDCYTTTRLCQQPVYSNASLAPGTHTIKVVKTSGACMLVDGFAFGNGNVISGVPTTAGSATVIISATNAGGSGSAALTITIDAGQPPPDTQAPTVPANLNHSSVTTSSFTLSWSPATDNVAVTGYEVLKDGVHYDDTSSTSMSVTGLSANTTYAMTVKAFDATGNRSAASGVHSVTTNAVPPPPDTQAPTVPANLNHSSVTTSSFTLSWSPATDNVAVTGYEVLKDGVHYDDTSSTSMSVTGLSASTTYAMTVKAFDATGNRSAASGVHSVTTNAVPPPPDTQPPTVPAGLVKSNATATSFTLTWTASTDNVGVTGYLVQIGADTPRSTTSPSIDISGLIQGTDYELKVKAGDAAGNWSDWSSPLTVITTDTQAPSVPTGLADHSVTMTSFTLTWSSSTDNRAVTAYEVLKDGSPYDSTSSTSMDVTGLSPGTQYAMTVRAVDGAGNKSALSDPHSVTTTSPAPPELLVLNNSDNQSAPAGQFNPAPFDILVLTAGAGQPIPGAPVFFSVQSGGGLLALTNGGNPELTSTLSLFADEHGTAQVYYKHPAAVNISSRIAVTSGLTQIILSTTSTGLPGDSDANGLLDVWELRYFGHLGVDPNGDPDGDHLVNRDEMLAGRDPKNGLDAFPLPPGVHLVLPTPAGFFGVRTSDWVITPLSAP